MVSIVYRFIVLNCSELKKSNKYVTEFDVCLNNLRCKNKYTRSRRMYNLLIVDICEGDD